MKPSKGMQIEILVRYKRGFTSKANHRHKFLEAWLALINVNHHGNV